jgi:AraC-like DNA-binding protein
VHVVFEPPGSRIYGIMTGKFTRRLEGIGFGLGIKFRPGAFYPFIRYPVARIVDKTLPLESLFGGAAAGLETRVLGAKNDDEMVAVAESALVDILPEADENIAAAGRIVDQVSEDRTILRVEDLAARAGMSRRSLQRLFNRYVGASPKWVIGRYARAHGGPSGA